jgi:acetyl-CoA synthetase
MTVPAMATTEAFRAARDFLLDSREDYQTAYRDFRWPELPEFNWALDWFDAVLATERGEQTGLWLVEDDGRESRLSFAQLSRRSTQVAGWLREQGLRRGDHLLLLLGNQVELWEVTLAAIKIGAVLIPATTLLGPADLRDRISRGTVSVVIAGSADTAKFADVPGDYTRIAVGEPVEGWLRYSDSETSLDHFDPAERTRGGDPMLLYFTSGTTAMPKLVEHTHVSYPVGHLSTMYWIGVQPGDVHLNISSPGWAKHAWSCVFAPWNAGATVLVHNYARFSARALLDVIARTGVTTFCAPPTVWRMLVQEDLSGWQVPARELVSAGEPLNPEVIEQVQKAWGITVRDGYGQTETTAQIGNSPAQPVRLGSMGRPLPGYRVALLEPVTGQPADEGEICLNLGERAPGERAPGDRASGDRASGDRASGERIPGERPAGLMTGYRDDPERTAEVMRHGYYHTGDVASRSGDGYITYVGRADDVFKASDYRISPFELESVLVEHEYVAEAAVVPAPDPVRLAVPKAYVVLAAGHQPTRDTALAILRFCREQLAPYKRVRRIEFAELPKTISGKIRRVDLRNAEAGRAEAGRAVTGGAVTGGAVTGRAEAGRAEAGESRRPAEFWEEDFPELRSP